MYRRSTCAAGIAWVTVYGVIRRGQQQSSQVVTAGTVVYRPALKIFYEKVVGDVPAVKYITQFNNLLH